MKKLLAFTVCAMALLPTAQSIAADVTLPPPPVVQLRPASYDWTGFYAGAWTGIACLDGRGSLVDNTTPSGPWNNGGCGFKGGGLLGYNHQINHFVVGAEIDLGMTSELARNTQLGADFTFKANYLATLRGRAGYAMDDTLIYLTAGGAYAQGEINSIVSAKPKGLKADQFGWTVGAGVEHAMTDHLRLRLEYMYAQFPTTKYQTGCCNIDWNWGGEHEVKVAAIWSF